MKKLFFLSLFTLASIAANAQLVKSRTFAKEESNTTWYTRLGLSFNNIAGNPEYLPWSNQGSDFSWGTKAGYDISFGFQKPISHSDIYWGMDLGIGTRGYTNNYLLRDGNKINEKLNTHNVNFSPLTFGYKHEIFDQLSIDLHIGGYFSYDFAYKQNLTYDETGETYDEIESYNSIDEHLVRYDAGIAAGAGVWYNRFNLDFTYQRGFINAIEYDEDMHSSKFMVRIGVRF